MRVISGKYKGKKIEGFNIDGTRPTMDRVKESVFGSIQNYINYATTAVVKETKTEDISLQKAIITGQKHLALKIVEQLLDEQEENIIIKYGENCVEKLGVVGLDNNKGFSSCKTNTFTIYIEKYSVSGRDEKDNPIWIQTSFGNMQINGVLQ